MKQTSKKLQYILIILLALGITANWAGTVYADSKSVPSTTIVNR